MSATERTGVRDLLYSGWHRVGCLRRYLGTTAAAKVCAIDIDWCEYCCYCGEPVALIETQQSTAAPKSARVTRRLAQLAGIPAYSVSYEATAGGDDIARFQVRQIAPSVGVTTEHDPHAYARWLMWLRSIHSCAAETAGTAA